MVKNKQKKISREQCVKTDVLGLNYSHVSWSNALVFIHTLLTISGNVSVYNNQALRKKIYIESGEDILVMLHMNFGFRLIIAFVTGTIECIKRISVLKEEKNVNDRSYYNIIFCFHRNQSVPRSLQESLELENWTAC